MPTTPLAGGMGHSWNRRRLGLSQQPSRVAGRSLSQSSRQPKTPSQWSCQSIDHLTSMTGFCRNRRPYLSISSAIRSARQVLPESHLFCDLGELHEDEARWCLHVPRTINAQRVPTPAAAIDANFNATSSRFVSPRPDRSAMARPAPPLSTATATRVKWISSAVILASNQTHGEYVCVSGRGDKIGRKAPRSAHLK